jgi:hypothetical protein
MHLPRTTATTAAHLFTTSSEVMWLHPDYAPRYLWDSSLGGQDSYKQTGAEVRGLVARAFRGPLLPAQQQQVLTELQADRYYLLYTVEVLQFWQPYCM